MFTCTQLQIAFIIQQWQYTYLYILSKLYAGGNNSAVVQVHRVREDATNSVFLSCNHQNGKQFMACVLDNPNSFKFIHFVSSVLAWFFLLLLDDIWIIDLRKHHHSHIFASKKLKVEWNRVEIEVTASLRRNCISIFSCF